MIHAERTPGPLRLAYDDLGSGEPALLLLPGWCSSRERWRPAATFAAAHRRVISMEWRGHGDSDPAPLDFGTAELVADALAVLDAAGAGTVVPCSASHAGWVAIELRRLLGERVPKIVHTDWTVTPLPERASSLIAQLVTTDWQEARRSLFSVWAAGLETREILGTLALMEAHGEEMWRRAGREILAAYAFHGSPLEALSRLAGPPPVLHLYGQPQDAAYLAEQERFAARNPWFAVSKLGTKSHFSMVESPQTVADAVERFVAA